MDLLSLPGLINHVKLRGRPKARFRGLYLDAKDGLCLIVSTKGAEGEHLSQFQPAGSPPSLGESTPQQRVSDADRQGYMEGLQRFLTFSCPCCNWQTSRPCLHSPQRAAAGEPHQPIGLGPPHVPGSVHQLLFTQTAGSQRAKMSLGFYVYNCFDMDCLLEAEIMIAFKARMLDREGG